MRPELGPLLVPTEALAAGAWEQADLPATLMRTWRKAVAAGWDTQVIYVRAADVESDGSPKFIEREEPLFDEGGNRLLSPTGRPRITRVKTEALRVVDTLNLIARTTYEGAPRELTVLWSAGRFAGALMRQPLLRLSSPEVTMLIANYGAPPDRQAGVPLSLAQELAAKAAARVRENEDESDG